MALFKGGAGTPGGALPAGSMTRTDEESILGANVSLRADVDFEGALRIDGRIEGNISGQGRLTITAGAQIIGEISVAELLIDGAVQGNVAATDSLSLGPSAQLVGDFTCARLAVSLGAKLRGTHNVATDAIAELAAAPRTEESPARKSAAKPKAAASKGDPLAGAF